MFRISYKLTEPTRVLNIVCACMAKSRNSQEVKNQKTLTGESVNLLNSSTLKYKQ